MSYTIDVYRRELAARRRYLDYLLFVCFFPHLVAGPIVRPRQMLPQLAARAASPTPTCRRAASGSSRRGSPRRSPSATTLSREPRRPRRSTTPSASRRSSSLVAVYAYAIQIYCDFSGYTDVAIGSALLFGYRLPENFDAPYTARNLQDFWHRWHISLSTWLRDYLYVPLGGSRGGAVQDLPEPDDHDGPRRPLARGLVELRHLGRPSRGRAGRDADVAAGAHGLPLPVGPERAAPRCRPPRRVAGRPLRVAQPSASLLRFILCALHGFSSGRRRSRMPR